MIDNLHELLLNPMSLDEVSVSELEALIAEFPAVGIFKVLLAKKMNRPDEDNLVNQVNDPVMMALYMNEASEFESKIATSTNNITVQSEVEPIVETAKLENQELYSINKAEDLEIERVTDDVVAESNVIETETVVSIIEEMVDEKEEQNIEIFPSLKIIPIEKSSNTETKKDRPTKSKKRKASGTKAKDLVGLSDYGQWLLGFKDKEIATKIEKARKKSEKKKRKDQIKESAMLSVTKSDQIISEPLANILASQGHLDEAKKMFEQLMVRNPEKSSYFAAQINNLIKFLDK